MFNLYVFYYANEKGRDRHEGIYQGIEKIEVDKISKDYMKISYAKGGNLYIPATQLDLIQKYASADAKKPKLNKLGTQEWNRTKTKVRGAVKEIARDLVKLYAARQEQDGYVYGCLLYTSDAADE